jgi:catechol 2,3-dioxygenase-like lactoylglutathione lyase family enzyme
MASMRYIVRDVDTSNAFYRGLLGFELIQQYGPAMGILRHGGLTLWIAGPMASASKPMPDGRSPEPGGWNRFVLQVPDLAAMMETLAANGAVFRNAILSGPGGQQILCEYPSGNVVELFQPG